MKLFFIIYLIGYIYFSLRALRSKMSYRLKCLALNINIVWPLITALYLILFFGEIRAKKGAYKKQFKRKHE